ncbi:MAG: MGH1-like glycoside hydrolase domain-containing protein [Hyphomicrobiales bacterium]
MSVPTYLRTPNVPLHRAWNSWAADRYLEMNFKPLGVRLSPMLFSNSRGRAIFPGPGHEVRLGTHTTDGSHIDAKVTHGGTSLEWRWAKVSAYDLHGGWSVEKSGEWGLRFWVVLVLSQDDGAIWHYDEARGIAHCTVGPRNIAIKSRRAPLLVTGHETDAEVATQYETEGYWYLGSRAASAKVLALRFNLEEAPENQLSVAIADRLDLAMARAESFAEPLPLPPADEARAAVRDIMGWNTIWDNVNHRPYITCSRNWDLKKFGGFGFWLNDMAVNALLVSLFDADQARECLATLLMAATPEGNLPCIMTGNDAWVDRTQSPLVSYITWQVYKRTGNRSLLELAYPILARNNSWIRRARDGNGNGLLEFGSSDVGLGLYKGTKLAAKDESFMDNSPIHDEAQWNPKSRTLDCEDVGLNSLVCLDSEMLALIAQELGGDGPAHAAHAEELRTKISSTLWDGERRIFANRLWSGKFVKSVGPTSFLPLVAGAATAEQTKHLIARLNDEKEFGGAPGLPSVSRSDPALLDNVYWRGRIWPILNWLVWNGLKRAGETKAAGHLRKMSFDLFMQSWRERRLAPENYHPGSGEGLDQPDTDPFYSWTALLPYMSALDDQ